MDARSFCYLLDSKHPRASSLGGRTYIGFTVNPLRRQRQHNGLLANGAFKTRKWRPWEMVVLVSGFANQRTALQFEWTWQHGEMSLDTREAMVRLKELVQQRFAYAQKRTLKLNGAVGQILRLVAILSTSPWKYFPLHVRVSSGALWRLVGDALRMLVDDRAGGDGDGFLMFPEHIGVSVGPLEDFLAQLGADEDASGSDNECGGEGSDVTGDDGMHGASTSVTPSPEKLGRKNMKIRCLVCLERAQRTWSACSACGGRVHVGCLGAHFLRHGLQADATGTAVASVPVATRVIDLPKQHACLPDRGPCPHCQVEASWCEVLSCLRTAGWRKTGGAEATDHAEDKGGIFGAVSTESKKESVVQKEQTKGTKGAGRTSGRVADADLAADNHATPRSAASKVKYSLKSLTSRIETLEINHGGETREESLASRCLRRLQEQETSTPGSISEQGIIDLCASSSCSSDEDVNDVVDVIDLSGS